MSSGPDYYYCRDAAGDDDQRDGAGESGRGRVDRRSWILSGPPRFWFRRRDGSTETSGPGRNRDRAAVETGSTQNYLRDAFPSISAWHDHESRTKDRADRFRA